MKIKALVTMLVLGTSSVAMARPAAPPAFAPEVRDHRDLRDRDTRTPPRFERWSLLASSHLSRGRAIVPVNTTKIDKLKLELVGPGSLFVDKLVVTFRNGRSQTIEVDKWVTQRSFAAIVDLEGANRKVTSIAVHGRGNGSGFRAGASFKLLAI